MINWYAAKCLYQHKPLTGVRRQMFEERIILVRAEDFASAEAKTMAEATQYTTETGLISFIDIINIYELDANKSINDLQEVYSTMYSSNLRPKKFQQCYFPNPHLDDCVKHNLRHRWFRKDKENYGCYHCLKTQKIDR